jgi:hypothetical protein
MRHNGAGDRNLKMPYKILETSQNHFLVLHAFCFTWFSRRFSATFSSIELYHLGIVQTRFSRVRA